jgi:hypothetical protein
MNGFQLFVKDKAGKGCYSEWSNIEWEETWFQITWVEPSMDVKEADPDRCDPSFNSAEPAILGLKVAVGTNSEVSYDAPLTIYLDDVDWKPLEP